MGSSEEHVTKVETGLYSPVNLDGQDSTKSVYSIDFKFTAIYSDLGSRKIGYVIIAYLPCS